MILEASWGHTIHSRIAGMMVRVEDLSVHGFLEPLWVAVGGAAARNAGYRTFTKDSLGEYAADLVEIGGSDSPVFTLRMGLMPQSGKFFVAVMNMSGDAVADAEFPLATVMGMNYKMLAQRVNGVIRKAGPGQTAEQGEVRMGGLIETTWGPTIMPLRSAALTVQVPILTMTGFLAPYWAKVGELAARAVAMTVEPMDMDPGVYTAELKGKVEGLVLSLGMNHQTGRVMVRVDGSNPVATAEYPLPKVLNVPVRTVAQWVANVIRKALGHPQEPETAY